MRRTTATPVLELGLYPSGDGVVIYLNAPDAGCVFRTWVRGLCREAVLERVLTGLGRERAMQKISVYIGADNVTGQLDSESVEASFGRHFDGFSSFAGVGYWNGMRERMLKIELLTEAPVSDVAWAAAELAARFGQELVLVESVVVEVRYVRPETVMLEDASRASAMLAAE